MEIRRRVLNGEISKRGACVEYDIHWKTLEKILTFTEPPGYRLSQPRGSKVDPFLPIIKEILESDKKVHRKQRHTAQRIFERLRDEHGFDGGRTIVSDAVRKLKQQNKEVFFPLSHPPGEAQVDYGFADVLLNGELTKVALFVMTLPYSDAIFIQAFVSYYRPRPSSSLTGRRPQLLAPNRFRKGTFGPLSSLVVCRHASATTTVKWLSGRLLATANVK